MKIRNPYSAEHPVPPEKFAGRKNQLNEFERFLDDTISGNSKNLVVLGSWGIGKTSLLRMFKHLVEQRGCAATIIELGEATDSFITLFETITQSLAKDAQHLKKITAKAKEFLESLSLSVNYGPIGVSFYERKKATPNTIKFREDLISIHKQIKSPYLIMLDNAEQLLNIKGSVFELRNIFQMLQSMDGVNSMLILSGKETLFSDIHSVSEPAVRFFWGIELREFTYEETKEAIEKPLKNTSINFSEECIWKIHELSQGHPYFVQVFAYNLFSLGKNKISLNDLESNYSRILDFLGKRLFEGLYRNVSLNERKVILAFTKSEKEILTNVEISELSRVKSVNRYLKTLSELRQPILLKTERGRYNLFHPLFKEYLRQVK